MKSSYTFIIFVYLYWAFALVNLHFGNQMLYGLDIGLAIAFCIAALNSESFNRISSLLEEVLVDYNQYIREVREILQAKDRIIAELREKQSNVIGIINEK